MVISDRERTELLVLLTYFQHIFLLGGETVVNDFYPPPPPCHRPTDLAWALSIFTSKFALSSPTSSPWFWKLTLSASGAVQPAAPVRRRAEPVRLLCVPRRAGLTSTDDLLLGPSPRARLCSVFCSAQTIFFPKTFCKPCFLNSGFDIFWVFCFSETLVMSPAAAEPTRETLGRAASQFDGFQEKKKNPRWRST